MPFIALPRTAGCIVCGPANPHGLRLTSQGDHGGVLATVADEAMVWAAIWASRRSCVAGELSVRYRRPAAPGVPLTVVTSIVRTMARLIETAATITDPAGHVVATATAKYLAGSADETTAFLATLLIEAASEPAVTHLRGA